MNPALKVAFNTANLVGRVSGYRFKLQEWGKQHALTVEKTDENAWRDICRQIAGAGYAAVEIWKAHADPSVMTAEKARAWLRILSEHHLTPIGYAGDYSADAVRVCEWLGIRSINGRLPAGATIDEFEKLARKSGVRFNFENHPEKSVAEILQPIHGGSEVIGVAVDTGWLGTQGVDAVQAIDLLGPLLRHVHLKDVRAAGGHQTCPLNTGVVGISRLITELKRRGYAGWYSWEDEPEERNPMDIAADARVWIEKELAR